MKSATKRASGLTSSGVVVVLITWFLTCPNPAAAQGSEGQDAVYNSSGGTVGSSAFIDASAFATQTDTICSTIYKILTPSSYSAAVIDARGFPGSTGASMTCAAGTTPWNNGTTYLNKPSAILLPATGGTNPTPIVISTPWVLGGWPGLSRGAPSLSAFFADRVGLFPHRSRINWRCAFEG